MNNLARMSLAPESLPSHIDLADGVVQINDEAGFGSAGGLTTFSGTTLGIDRLGPSAARQVTEQWGADATTDPVRLTELQSLYRAALGLPPLPESNAIAYLRRTTASGGKSGSSSEKSSRPSTASPGSPSADSSGSDSGKHVPVEILLADVPMPGWFHFGCRRDVPADACYVGQHGDRAVWVTADGVPALARFTVAVLAVVKYEPRNDKPRGLAVTR